MIKTKQRTRKQISNLSLEIEIINPIESKTLFGGCNYCNNGYSQATGWACQNQYYSSSSWNSGPTSPANFSGFVFSGPTDNSWGSSYTGNENYSDTNGDGINDADQTNTWSDANGDGINDADQHGLPNLPAVVPLQLDTLGSCVSYAISFTSNYLGQQTNPLSTALNIDQILGLPSNPSLFQSTSFTHGLNPAQATQAIQSYFTTNQVTNIQQVNAAIDANHPVIANYITGQTVDANGNITITAHEVVIVEYNDWNYRVANSLTGQYNWVSQNDITFQNGAYEITGINP
jgi:hypothetical protein